MTPGASGAVGERGISVAGDVVGSVIVTGDNNNVNLVLGAHQGALLERLARSRRPSKRLRPAPVRSTPPPFADSLDRDGEVRTILDALGSRTPINLLGPRGIGKTYTLLRALNADDPALADGAVYLYAPGPLDDVLQLIFEAWYECEPPFKPSNPQLRRDLAEIHGLVALDSVELERDSAQQVVLAAAGCRIVVASRERALTEGTSLTLSGLEPEYAIALVEREIGRPLEAGEREDAARVCSALEGHPLKIREAVAAARAAGDSLADLASRLGDGRPDAVLSRAKLRAADEDGRRLLAALALFGDATVGKDHLHAIAGVDDFEQALMAALRRRDVLAHSPRYSLGATLAAAMPDVDLASTGGRALAHFAAWAEENRARPSALVTESSALVALLRWAVRAGRHREAIGLGRAVDHAFALERRFGAWGQVLDLVHAAALAVADRDSQAWALHQLGTRALCLGEVAAGSAMLAEAIELRRELGDAAGARDTARNLAVATRSRGLWPWIAGHSLLLGVALAVVVAGVVAAATLQHHSHPSQNASSPAGTVAQPGGSSTPSKPSADTNTSGGTQPSTTPTTKVLSLQVVGTGSVAIDPGHGTCPASCVLSLKTGTALSLAATPGDGFLFQGWSGGCSGSNSPCTLTMTQDWSVTASFTTPVTLSIITRGVAVTSDKGKISCPGTCSEVFPAQTTVTLTAATPAYWFGAPGCAQRPQLSSTATQNGVAPQSTAATAQSDGGSTTAETGPQSTSTTTPPATTSTTPPPVGGTTCRITLDRSYKVGVLPAAS